MLVNLSVVGRIRGLSLTAVVVMIAALLMSSAMPGELSAADAEARPAYSVDVSGDLAVIGASWEDGYSGAAYVLQARRRRLGDRAAARPVRPRAVRPLRRLGIDRRRQDSHRFAMARPSARGVVRLPQGRRHLGPGPQDPGEQESGGREARGEHAPRRRPAAG